MLVSTELARRLAAHLDEAQRCAVRAVSEDPDVKHVRSYRALIRSVAVKLAIAVLLGACSAAPAPVATPCPAPASTSPGTRPAAIGETFDLPSKLLGQTRVINVYLPPDYSKGGSFPVMYMPDGGIAEDFPHVAAVVDVSIRNEVIKPMIIVGIENIERRRDLPGPTDVPDELKAAPHAGGNAQFRNFIKDELMPQIRARYHTTGETALIGESLAGLFVVDTLLAAPEMFDTFIAIDPSLWWSHQVVAKSLAGKFASWSQKPKQVYLTTSDLDDMQRGAKIVMDAYAQHHPAGLTITYDPLPAEHHNTIYPVAEVHALRLLFAR